MRTIPLTRGLFAQVDDSDFEKVAALKWHAWKGPLDVTFYAKHRQRLADGSLIDVTMHTFLLGPPPKGRVWDHRDRDGLNNQRQNLRAATRPQNRRNGRGVARSGYKGVYCQTKNWKDKLGHVRHYHYYTAALECDSKRFYLGTFKSPAMAALAYDAAAIEHFGEFAFLNFPNNATNKQLLTERIKCQR